MSVAPVTPISTAQEPTTLKEAYAQAKRDLFAKDATAHLRWVFWHAKAVARLEVARAALRRVESWDMEARMRSMSMERMPSVATAYEEARPKAALEQAEVVLSEAVALAEATRQVAEMLGARR